MRCSNRLEDGRECGDEGQCCEDCERKDAAYWAAYFGQTKERSRTERHRVLVSMAPVPFACGCEECAP